MSDVETAAGSAVPDANPAPEVVETPAVEATPESSPEPDPKAEALGFRKKIDKLTWQRREAERERDFYREQFEATKQPKATEPEAEKPHTLADFGFDEVKYQQHLFSEAEKRAVRAAEARLKEEQERTTKERTVSDFRKREETFAESVDDYHEVVGSRDLTITQGMADTLRAMDEGPAVAYYLGKNTDLAASIAQLPPMLAAAELGAIKAKLVLEREKAKAKPVSKAPPPTPKVEDADADQSIKVDDPRSDVLSNKEWTRRRNLQEAARKRNRNN